MIYHCQNSANRDRAATLTRGVTDSASIPAKKCPPSISTRNSRFYDYKLGLRMLARIHYSRLRTTLTNNYSCVLLSLFYALKKWAIVIQI